MPSDQACAVVTSPGGSGELPEAAAGSRCRPTPLDICSPPGPGQPLMSPVRMQCSPSAGSSITMVSPSKVFQSPPLQFAASPRPCGIDFAAMQFSASPSDAVDFGSPVLSVVDSSVDAVPHRARARALDGMEELHTRLGPLSPEKRSPGKSGANTTPDMCQRIPGHVWFNLQMNSSAPVTPYAEVYGQHPGLFQFDETGAMHPIASPVKGATITPTASALWDAPGTDIPLSPSNSVGAWPSALSAQTSGSAPIPVAPGVLLAADMVRPTSSSSGRRPQQLSVPQQHGTPWPASPVLLGAELMSQQLLHMHQGGLGGSECSALGH